MYKFNFGTFVLISLPFLLNLLKSKVLHGELLMIVF